MQTHTFTALDRKTSLTNSAAGSEEFGQFDGRHTEGYYDRNRSTESERTSLRRPMHSYTPRAERASTRKKICKCRITYQAHVFNVPIAMQRPHIPGEFGDDYSVLTTTCDQVLSWFGTPVLLTVSIHPGHPSVVHSSRSLRFFYKFQVKGRRRSALRAYVPNQPTNMLCVLRILVVGACYTYFIRACLSFVEITGAQNDSVLIPCYAVRCWGFTPWKVFTSLPALVQIDMR